MLTGTVHGIMQTRHSSYFSTSYREPRAYAEGAEGTIESPHITLNKQPLTQSLQFNRPDDVQFSALSLR